MAKKMAKKAKPKTAQHHPAKKVLSTAKPGILAEIIRRLGG